MSARERDQCMTTGIVPEDYSGEVAEDWPDLIEIVLRLVKPERSNQKRKAIRERWWQYADKRPGLYQALASLQKVFLTSRVSEHLGLASLLASMIYSHHCVVFA